MVERLFDLLLKDVALPITFFAGFFGSLYARTEHLFFNFEKGLNLPYGL